MLWSCSRPIEIVSSSRTAAADSVNVLAGTNKPDVNVIGIFGCSDDILGGIRFWIMKRTN